MYKNPIIADLRADVSIEDKKIIDETFALSERIYFLLEKHGMNQRQLAKKLNKSEAEISKWLSGGHNLTHSTIIRIGLAIGESVIYIPGGKNEDKKDIDEKIKVLKSLISRMFEQSSPVHNTDKFKKYSEKDISVLEVTTHGIVCNSGEQHFTQAAINPQAFSKIEKTTLT